MRQPIYHTNRHWTIMLPLLGVIAMLCCHSINATPLTGLFSEQNAKEQPPLVADRIRGGGGGKGGSHGRQRRVQAEQMQRTKSVFRCREDPTEPPVVVKGDKINLRKSRSDRLCVLARVRADSGEEYAAVARSYGGHGWENVAGPYVNNVRIRCKRRICRLRLPPPRVGHVFVLIAAHHSITPRQQVARFLEQATFGPRRVDLNRWRYNAPTAMEEWVQNQMEGIPPTLHRAYWRHRSTPRMLKANKYFEPTHPCDARSRWRRYAFTGSDLRQFVQVEASSYAEDGTPIPPYILSVGGQVRTIVDTMEFFNSRYKLEVPFGYKVCFQDIGERVNGRLFLEHRDRTCQEVKTRNPPVRVDESLWTPNLVLDLPIASNGDNNDPNGGPVPHTDRGAFVVTTPIDNPEVCRKIPNVGGTEIVYGRLTTGEYVLYDPHVQMESNTLQDPLPDGGGSKSLATGGLLMCSNVPRDILNEHSCRLSYQKSTCSRRAPALDEITVTLNHANLQTFYTLTGRYVYAVEDLRVDASMENPCTPSARSRWVKQDDVDCSNDLEPALAQEFSNFLRRAEGSLLRNVVAPNTASCPNNANLRGIKLLLDGQCWQNVHPDYWNVYDFTWWAESPAGHPGTAVHEAQDLPNPIAQPARQGQSKIAFPADHLMSSWNPLGARLEFVGTWEQDVSFIDLPDHLRIDEVAKAFGALTTDKEEGIGVMVCGSPGEVENDPFVRGGREYSYAMVSRDTLDLPQQRESVWTHIALTAQDQLRQRMAWALSQIFAISPNAFETRDNSESFLQFYDIFTRNAFGNFRDVLREVSYSPMMAQMLSYIRSKSTFHVQVTEKRLAFADENFAREVMQLFTTGPILLQMDGTPVFKRGETVRVYDNDDIMSFARAWTGFSKQRPRGNLEEAGVGQPDANLVDPMGVINPFRDKFPKMNLYDGFIGDRYPLCRDLPTGHFLRKNAQFRLLGSTSAPELVSGDGLAWKTDTTLKRMVLDPEGSALYAKLCNAGADGVCNFQNQVILTENLKCHETECNLETVRVVQVTPKIYYEYVRPHCVQLAFFNDGKTLRDGNGRGEVCADPGTAVAAQACCDAPNSHVAHRHHCEYDGERLRFASAQQRCQARGKQLCTFRQVSASSSCKFFRMFWTPSRCKTVAKVASDGKVGIVHSPTEPSSAPVQPIVRNDTISYFSVKWHNDTFPTVDGNNCGNGACVVFEGTCLCDVNVHETPAFRTVYPTRAEILEHLHVGFPDPSSFDHDEFSRFTFSATPNVMMYSRTGSSSSALDEHTVFEVQDDYGQTVFLRNVKYRVHLVGQDEMTHSEYSFRDPPHFVNLFDSALGEIYQETEAVLDHYFYHNNVPPFIALRLIQRFGISNPSPRYTRVVATAFLKGRYKSKRGGRTEFGTGKYGDLAATVAAILLDREARTALLDADPSFGSLREPLLKVIGFMRSMEFEATTPRIDLFDLDVKLGQRAHAIPSVFSYFLPEYIPDGRPTSASLKSPESQVLMTPTIVGILNGLFALIKFGLLGCHHGFGRDTCCECYNFDEGFYPPSWGFLSFTPRDTNPQAIVDEMATLLAPGRLSAENRQILVDEYSAEANVDPTAALQAVQQLLVATPEFHATGLVQKTEQERPKEDVTQGTPKDYKAIVYFLQDGGSDSFNMLVPHSECTGKDLYEEYKAVRNTVAVNKAALRQIDASRTPQPCKVFGLHPTMPTIQSLYNSRDLLFVANVGVLNQPVNKDNYMTKTKSELFAHNFMKEEVKRIDPYDKSIGNGILGRFIDILGRKGYRTSAISVEEPSIAVVGTPKVSPSAKVVQRGGQIHKFDPKPSSARIRPTMERLNSATNPFQSGIYGETWSQKLNMALQENDVLFRAIGNVTLNHRFMDDDVGGGFEAAAKFIAAHEERGSDRDVIFVRQLGYDHHVAFHTLQNRFREMDNALNSFVAEMKERGLWDKIVVINVSEFGRTMVPNGGEGTDHGWGGNYFLAGGEIDGGKILGQFPDDLTEASPLDVGRGRFIPTTPWEAVFSAVGDWFGISDEVDLNYAMPNRRTFRRSDMLSKFALFETDSIAIPTVVQSAKDFDSFPNKTTQAAPSLLNFTSPAPKVPPGARHTLFRRHYSQNP